MNDADVLRRLSDLGIDLPSPPQALAAYVPVRRVGQLAFVAGQVPMAGGEVLHPGRLGDDVTVEQGAEAARRAAVQALAALRGALGSFDPIEALAQVSVFVAATPDFTQHPQVANGASELFVEVMGDAGQHARAAVGVPSLPLGASVEVAVTAALA
ncbi:MAG TPA: RidA family protein [Actinomycetota bacterium]|nr:RidA family protein [Actinomycetota bacterium]